MLHGECKRKAHDGRPWAGTNTWINKWINRNPLVMWYIVNSGFFFFLIKQKKYSLLVQLHWICRCERNCLLLFCVVNVIYFNRFFKKQSSSFCRWSNFFVSCPEESHRRSCLQWHSWKQVPNRVIYKSSLVWVWEILVVVKNCILKPKYLTKTNI